MNRRRGKDEEQPMSSHPDASGITRGAFERRAIRTRQSWDETANGTSLTVRRCREPTVKAAQSKRLEKVWRARSISSFGIVWKTACEAFGTMLSGLSADSRPELPATGSEQERHTDWNPREGGLMSPSP